MRNSIVEEIYSNLTGVTGVTIYNDLLPANYSFSDNAITFKFQTLNSVSTFDYKNLANTYTLYIKVYSRSKYTMNQISELTKSALLHSNYNQLFFIEFDSAVDIYDYDNKTYINNIDFSFSSEN